MSYNKSKKKKKVHSSMFWIVRRPEPLSASQCAITGHWSCSKAVRVRFTALAESQKKGDRLDAATAQIETRGLKQDRRRGSGCWFQCSWSGSYNEKIRTSGNCLLPVRIWQVKGISFPTHWEGRLRPTWITKVRFCSHCIHFSDQEQISLRWPLQ